jgi:CheY-like chemotaxis protein
MQNIKKNILIVDDDQVSRFLHRRIFESWEFVNSVHAVSSGKDALEFFNPEYRAITAIPDIILLDLNMPVMNGFEFINAFRELDFPDKDKVLIVIATSSDNPEDIKHAHRLGIRHYITKPLTKDKVLSAILQDEPKVP